MFSAYLRFTAHQVGETSGPDQLFQPELISCCGAQPARPGQLAAEQLHTHLDRQQEPGQLHTRVTCPKPLKYP
jgi:hypothetical protein